MPYWDPLGAGNPRKYDAAFYKPTVLFTNMETWYHFHGYPDVIRRFLDILAARKDPAGLSGEVLIDGVPQPPNFKCLSGYVVQVDYYYNYTVSCACQCKH